MENIILTNPKTLAVSPSMVYHLHEVTSLEISLMNYQKIHDISIIYIDTAESGDIDIRFNGDNSGIDFSAIKNNEKWKFIVSENNSIEIEKLNDTNSGGIDVIANPTAEATETLEKLQIGDKVYTAPQGEQGEQGDPGEPGPANTLSIGTVTSGETASANITGDVPNQILNLTLPKGDTGPKGNDAVNPFKGWWPDFATLKSAITATAGDSAYIKDAAPATTWSIYVYDSTATSDNYWGDSGNDVDTSFVSSFMSGQTLNSVNIVDGLTTGGANNVANAESVKVIADDLYGPQQVSIDLSSYPLTNGLIVASDNYFRTEGNYGLKNRCKFIPIGDYKGRNIVVEKVNNNNITSLISILSEMPTSGNEVTYATGYNGIINITNAMSPYAFVCPNDAEYLYYYVLTTNDNIDKTPKSITVSASPADFYTKGEVDSLMEDKVDNDDFEEVEQIVETLSGKVDALSGSVYGVKWSLTDFDDEGIRVFGSVGKSASIGVGNTNGQSDFDNIWPWSDMKRCNIKTNANGAKIVTFEGEIGFALDGTNGDVFVRIPKFNSRRYIENGYEYITIGEGQVHPAFVEGGVELDEIFVGAFEASLEFESLYSKGGVIPTNNQTGASFLSAATSRGIGYTLADMRSVDAIWRLMAVEYGKRNSNRVLGYGYSDYYQAATYQTWLTVTQTASATNTVVCGVISSKVQAAQALTRFAPGNNICICNTNITTIVAQRKIISVSAENEQSLSVTFDGDAIDVTTDMFIGNAPSVCNYCETIDSSYKLNWHTGRSNRPVVEGSNLVVETTNPCRYRWIENPIGNLWQFLPDVKAFYRQLYVCNDITKYSLGNNTNNYTPIGDLLPLQESNGNKSDINTVANPNYWMTMLLDDTFAKVNTIGKAFDTVHDGTITSSKGYGGYYYMNDGQYLIVNGGGFDHLWRCNMLTNRAQIAINQIWYLYGARLMYKNL